MHIFYLPPCMIIISTYFLIPNQTFEKNQQMVSRMRKYTNGSPKKQPRNTVRSVEAWSRNSTRNKFADIKQQTNCMIYHSFHMTRNAKMNKSRIINKLNSISPTWVCLKCKKTNIRTHSLTSYNNQPCNLENKHTPK